MHSIKVDGIEYRFFDHLFAVSRCGKVLRKLLPYTPTRHPLGYLCLGRRRLMHRVVAHCWLAPPAPGQFQIHHKNENKTDNRADNLEWISPKEHMGDRHRVITDKTRAGRIRGAKVAGTYIRTEATRQKLRQYRLGKKDSRKTQQRKAEILAVVGPKRPIKFNGVTYPSVSAAARAAGLHLSTFRLWHLSKNSPEN